MFFSNPDSKNETCHKAAKYALSLPRKLLNIFYWLLLFWLFIVLLVNEVTNVHMNNRWSHTESEALCEAADSCCCWKTFISKFSYKNATPGVSVGRTMLFKTLCRLVWQGSSILGSSAHQDVIKHPLYTHYKQLWMKMRDGITITGEERKY